MKKHVALYQNKDILDNTFSYRCIITDDHENERKYDISHYSAKRLTELMYNKDIDAKVSMIGIITALHYWIEKDDKKMNNKQFTREELIKAQENHSLETSRVKVLFSYAQMNENMLQWILDTPHIQDIHTKFVLSALLAMSED